MSCCAVGCTNRAENRKDLHFYRFPCPKNPFEEERRDRWIQAVRRLDLTGNKLHCARLCSAHFITGQYSLDRNHPDFIPSIFFFTKPRDLQKGQDKLKRYKRTVERIERTKGVAYVPDTPNYTPEQSALFVNNTAFNWPSIKKAVPAHTAYITKVEENIHGLKSGEIIPFVVDQRRPPPVTAHQDTSAVQDSDEEVTEVHPPEGDVHEDHSYSTRTQPLPKPQPKVQPKCHRVKKPPEHRAQLLTAAAKDSHSTKTIVSQTVRQKYGKDAPTRPITQDKLQDVGVDKESVRKDHAYATLRQRSALIQCYICNRTVVGVETFRTHMSNHLGIKRHICPICDRRFAQKPVLTRHMKIHSSERPFGCSECGKRFKYRGSYKVHLSCHSGVHYECGHCDKKYNNEQSFREHVRNHEVNYRCPVCKKTFRTIESTNQHFQIHVKEQEIQAMSGTVFTMDYSTLTFEVIERRPSQFLCSECGVVFSKEASLRRHVCAHRREGMFRCPSCFLSFDSETERSRHVLEHHKGMAPFRCRLCPRSFRRYDALRMHHVRHTGERPLLCEVCGRRFIRRDQLQVHARTHTGERPYHCPICPKRFRSRKTLHVHQQTHSTQTYSCSDCPRRFKYQLSLKKHGKTHLRDNQKEVSK